MDLIIRGIEMPMPLCKTELIVFPSGVVQVYDSRENYLGKAEAAPLPEGHGKLIDIKDVKSAKFHIEGRAEMYSAYNIGWNDALDAVCMNAHSIVPAEGGTDSDSEL